MQILSETTTLLEISLHTFDHIVMENRNIIGAISKMTHLEKKKLFFYYHSFSGFCFLKNVYSKAGFFEFLGNFVHSHFYREKDYCISGA